MAHQDDFTDICFNCKRLDSKHLECRECGGPMCAKCRSISPELCKLCYDDAYYDDDDFDDPDISY